MNESPIDVKTLDKYSYSKISTYEQCKFKFKLKYLDKNFLFSANIATDFGSLIHETEETIANSIQQGLPINYMQLRNRFIYTCHKLALTYPEAFFARDKSGRTYQEKMYLYLDTAIFRLEKYMREHPTYEIIGIEQKFLYNYDNVHSFEGSIDRAFRDRATGEVIIQDIKSWAVPVQPAELKAPLQFTIYSLAAAQLYNVPHDKIRCEYDLPLCDIQQAATSETLVADGTEVLDKLFKGIQDGNFKPTVSALCHWCPHNPLVSPNLINERPQAVCPYFSTWQKSGDKVRDTLIKWEGIENVEVDRQFCISQLRQAQQSTEGVAG